MLWEAHDMSLLAARVAPEKADFRPALPMSLLPGANGAHMTMKTEKDNPHCRWR